MTDTDRRATKPRPICPACSRLRDRWLFSRPQDRLAGLVRAATDTADARQCTRELASARVPVRRVACVRDRRRDRPAGR